MTVRLAQALVYGAAAFAALQAGAQSGRQAPSCLADAYAAQAAEHAVPWPRQVPPMALTPGCWLEPAQWRQAGSGGMLVDVRPLPQRRSAPIAHALQMDVQELAGKRFLQQEQILLLGTGLDHADLDTACRQLRGQGFGEVRALMGGAAALRPQGPVVQNLVPRDWIAGLAQGAQWTVLSFSEAMKASPVEQHPVPDGQMRQVTTPQGLPRALDAIATGPLADGRAQALVVIADAPAEPALHAQLASEMAARRQWPQDLPIYWLQGGWQAYQAQVASMQAIGRTASHRLQAACGRF